MNKKNKEQQRSEQRTKVIMEVSPYEFYLLQRSVETLCQKTEILLGKDLDLEFTKKMTNQKKALDQMLKELF